MNNNICFWQDKIAGYKIILDQKLRYLHCQTYDEMKIDKKYTQI